MGALFAAASFSREVSADASTHVTTGDASATQTLTSPDGSVEVTVDVSSGAPTYNVTYDGTTVVQSSTLGFDFQNQPPFGTSTDGSTGPGLSVTGTTKETRTESWDPVWDQYDSVSEEYTLCRIGLAESSAPNRTANLEFRVFDDGVGFRFVFDESFDDSGGFAIASENTRFAFGGDYTAWWIRNHFVNPRFEQEYTESALSEVPAGDKQTGPNGNTVRKGAHTPLTLKADDSTYLSVHEADLTDYATMSVTPVADGGGTEFESTLAPLPDGTRVTASGPHATPWRTIQVGSSPGDLVESSLVPLLNDDVDTSVLPTDGSGNPDTSWITPKKYVGIWWMMIAGSAKWEYKSDAQVRDDGGDPRQWIHGAQTERMKRYMRFASENAIDSVLVEGWNVGWDSYPGSGDTLDMDASYPDFDLPTVTDFGQSLSPSVEMTAHNETAGNIPNYESQILDDGIFGYYEDNHIRSIKNGFVADSGLGFEGDGTTASHNHHCQLAVNFHELVAQEAAKHRQLLEMHESVKPTGKRRKYPNLTSREVVKAQEYDGFGELASPVSTDHHVTLPFTRMLAGPTSYQAGLFDITFNDNSPGQAGTTRAKQLAMYPNYVSGLQMAADRIEAYVNPELGVGELVQAQSGELDGLITADKWRNAYGAHYVAVDPNRVDAGSSVSFTVTDVPGAGEYDLHLRYASDAEQNATRVQDNGGPQATLTVNDTSRTIEPSFTEDWDQWETFTTTVSLDQGDNAVAVGLDFDDSGSFTGDVGGFNLDAVAVTETGGSFPSTPANENFETVPEFKYVEDVPADWDDTRVLDAEIGEYVVTARRKGEDWYVGAMTNGAGRAIEVALDFLGSKANGWVLELYGDGPETSVDENQTDVTVHEAHVTSGQTVLASMPASGGTAMRLRPATSSEASSLPSYAKPTQQLSVAIDESTDISSTFVTATGSNDSSRYVGGTNVVVEVDGAVDSRRNVRLAPGASDVSVAIDKTFDTPGTYAVSVERADGTVLASGDVTVESPQTVAAYSDPSGDDAGPGTYTYPTDSAFEDGAFDLERFEIEQTTALYRFTFEVANLTDAFGSQRGFSPQLFALWLRDPGASDGRTTQLEGDAGLYPNVDFASAWQYRLRVDGYNLDLVDATGASVTDANGDAISPDVNVDAEAGTVTVAVPRSAFGATDMVDMEVLPAVGSEDYGSFRAVKETAEGYAFGGADPDAVANAPFLVDVLTATGTAQSDALAYSASDRAQVPFTPVYDDEAPGASHVATFADESGDDHAWGEVSYPEAGVHADPGSLDLTRLDVYETADRYFLAARFAETFDNPNDTAAGFTRPHLRLFLRDPSQGGTTTKGGLGCHPYGNKEIVEDAGWHRVVDVQSGFKAVQDTGFNSLATDAVGRRVPVRNDTIVVDFAKDLLPAAIRDLDVTAVVFPWASNTAGIAKIEEQQYAATNGSGERTDFYRPNTSASNYYHTNVVDVLTPDGVEQSLLDPANIQNSGKSGDQSFSEYQIPLLSTESRANSILEAVAGEGPVTSAHFETVQAAYERGAPVAGTGGLVPDYADLRAVAREVSEE